MSDATNTLTDHIKLACALAEVVQAELGALTAPGGEVTPSAVAIEGARPA